MEGWSLRPRLLRALLFQCGMFFREILASVAGERACSSKRSSRCKPDRCKPDVAKRRMAKSGELARDEVRSRVQPTYSAHDRRVKGDFRQGNHSRSRHEADRSDRRAAPPGSRVVGVALDAARRPRAQPTELRARDRREQGSERSLAGSRRPSTSDPAFVPRLADSCLFPGGKNCTKCLPRSRRHVGVTSHVNV